MHLELWKIVVLAAIQGATEFLPISSSGHLVIAAEFLSPGNAAGIDISDLNIVLHVGTLGSIVAFYFQRIFRLLGEDRRVIWSLAIASLPAILVGVPIKLILPDPIENAIMENALLAGFLLPVTGLILILGTRNMDGKVRYQEMTWWQALWMGVAQAFAILPGISRSGSTIAAGMRLGLTPNSSATFSFLMAIPVIAGAGLIELVSLVKDGGPADQTPLSHLCIGMLVAFVVGYVCLVWLVRWLEKGRFALFAWWCIPAGIGVILWQLSLRFAG